MIKILDLITAGETAEALEAALRSDDFSPYVKKLHFLLNRHKQNESDNRLGVLDSRDYERVRSNIVYELLHLIEAVESKSRSEKRDLGINPSVTTERQQKGIIGQISKHPLASLALSASIVISSFIIGPLSEIITKTRLQDAGSPEQQIIIGLLLVIAVIILAYRSKREKDRFPRTATKLTTNQKKIFIEQLRRNYNHRLEQKLDDRLAIELEFRNVGTDISKSYYLRQQVDKGLDDEILENRLLELVAEYPFLLILGKPGSGKTSCLLKLAVGMLEQAAKEELAVPVVFNLAGWGGNVLSFDKWLSNYLVSHYSYPKHLATGAVDSNQIIPLLDGFDEVGMHLATIEQRKTYRERCLQAIQHYQNRKNSPSGIIICSRIEEIQDFNDHISVDAQILLKDVTIEMVEESLATVDQSSEGFYSRANKNAAKNLLSLMNTSPALQSVLRSPFYFNAAIQVMNQAKDNELRLPEEAEEIKRLVLELFIRRKLDHDQAAHTAKDTRHYLSWLAAWLQRQQRVSFELRDFQPADSTSFVKYGLVYGLIAGLVTGLVVALDGLLLMRTSFEKSIVLASIVTLLISVVGFGIGGYYIYQNGIKAAPRRVIWSRLGKPKAWLSMLVYSLILSLTLGTLFWIVFDLFQASLGGLVFGLVFGFLMGLALGFRENVTEEIAFLPLDRPYRRFVLSFRYLSYTIAFAALICSIIYFYNNSQWSLLAKVARTIYVLVLFGGLSFFLSSLYQHIVLNFCLKSERKLPLPMAAFFDYCSDLRILEKEGASWRFRHQIIHDYFVQNDSSKAHI